MRHNKRFNHLSRKKAHRDALMANMTISLIEHKRIITTLAKAKALRGYAEHIINVAQRGLKADAQLAEGWNNENKPAPKDQASRRLVFSYLQSKRAVTELFGVVAPKVGDRPGGYTRILKTGIRHGDNSVMAIIELVDYNENMLKAVTEKKAKSTRRSRGKKAEAPEAPAATTEEAPKAE